MRKSLAGAIASVVLLVWWFGHDLNVRAQGGGGASCVQEIPGDVNGDQTFDISDGIYILQRLFLGGPPPCALAGSCDVCLTPEQVDEMAFGRKIAGAWLQQVPSRGLMTVSADGGVEGEAIEGITGRFDFRATTSRGTWKRRADLGERQVEVRTTRMVFLDINGTPWKIDEFVGVMTINDNFTEMSGTLTWRACEWDSWSPDGYVVTETGNFTLSATRIPI